MTALDKRAQTGDETLEDLQTFGRLALELAMELNIDSKPEAAAAVGMWLFGGTVEKLPGGSDEGEWSRNSPVRKLKSFLQDMVLVGRSSIQIMWLSVCLHGNLWSLASQWAPIARAVLSNDYSMLVSSTGCGGIKRSAAAGDGSCTTRVRLRQVLGTFQQRSKGCAMVAARKLRTPI
jgi:hypothetical protein